MEVYFERRNRIQPHSCVLKVNMKNNKFLKNLILSLFCFVLLLFLVIGLIGKGARHSKAQEKTAPAPSELGEKLTKNSARPLGDLESPAEASEIRLRRLRRESLGRGRYRRGIMDPGVREVNGQAETVLMTFIDGVTILKPGERADPPGLPVSSTAIVVGTVKAGKAFVSEDRTFVYSDFQVMIDEVIKADPARMIPVGSQLVAWVSGGSIRFPSGHLRHFIISGRGFPESGTQYVLFLRRTDPSLREYAIATAYALKDGITLPLDDAGDSKSFEGMKVEEFLNIIRNSVASTEDSEKR